MKLFKTSLLILVFLLSVNTAHAASKEQCELLWGINPSVECDASTPISKIDEALGITGQVAKAKAYLLSIARDLRGSKAPSTCEQNIYRLNNTFAVCSAHFLSAYQSVHGEGSAHVVSAFRPPEDLGDGCGSNKAAGGAPHSNHMYGRAMDVNPSGKGSSFKTLESFARNNPQFGVCFPYIPKYSGGSFYDAPHMALAGIDTGEARLCALQGVTDYCSGSPEFDPNQSLNAEYADVVETEVYGDTLEYESDSIFDFSKIFGTTSSSTYDDDTYDDYVSFDETGYDYFDYEYDDYTSTELVYDTDTSTTGDFVYVVGNDSVGYVATSVGDDNAADCSGLFGIDLFSTCDDSASEESSFWTAPITSISDTLSFTDEGEDSGTIIGGSLNDGLYEVHDPTDSASVLNDFYINYGEFAEGTVPIEKSNEVDVVYVAGKSVQWGTYYGVRDAMSPLLFGGAYRALLRFEAPKTIYNPFLLHSL